MGAEHSFCRVFLQSDFVSFANIDRSYLFLGSVIEEMAVRLAERVSAIFCCSGAIVFILISACAQWRLNGWEDNAEEQVNLDQTV